MLKELPTMPQFKIFIKNKLIFISLILALLVNVAIWIILSIKIGKQIEPIALHYNIYFGIDRIGAWYNIYILPLGGLLIIIFNWLFGLYAYAKDNKNIILGYFLNFGSLFVQLLLLAASILLILINK